MKLWNLFFGGHSYAARQINIGKGSFFHALKKMYILPIFVYYKWLNFKDLILFLSYCITQMLMFLLPMQSFVYW